MSPPFVFPVDPARLDRLPAPEVSPATPGAPDGAAKPDKPASAWIERLATVSPLEADVVELRARGCLGHDIAAILGVTQAAISMRHARGLERLKYLAWLESLGIDRDRMFVDLETLGLDIVDQLLVVAVWETSSLSEATRRLRYAPLKAMTLRWRRFVRLVTWAAELNPRFEPYARWVEGLRWRILSPCPRERRPWTTTTTTTARDAIVALVEAEPGLSAPEIRTRLGLTVRQWDTARQQLLERAAIMTVGRRPHGYRYYVTRTSP